MADDNPPEPKSERYESAVITFRPENILTIGLMAAVAYLGAVIVAQLLMRAGIVKGAAPVAAGGQQVPGTVVV
jgi:hypothetical protein